MSNLMRSFCVLLFSAIIAQSAAPPLWTPWQAFRGTGGILVTTNPATLSVTVDGSGISGPTNGTTSGQVTGIVNNILIASNGNWIHTFDGIGYRTEISNETASGTFRLTNSTAPGSADFFEMHLDNALILHFTDTGGSDWLTYDEDNGIIGIGTASVWVTNFTRFLGPVQLYQGALVNTVQSIAFSNRFALFEQNGIFAVEDTFNGQNPIVIHSGVKDVEVGYLLKLNNDLKDVLGNTGSAGQILTSRGGGTSGVAWSNAPAGGGGGAFNVNQFSATTVTNIKAGAFQTNANFWSSGTNHGDWNVQSGALFMGTEEPLWFSNKLQIVESGASLLINDEVNVKTMMTFNTANQVVSANDDFRFEFNLLDTVAGSSGNAGQILTAIGGGGGVAWSNAPAGGAGITNILGTNGIVTYLDGANTAISGSNIFHALGIDTAGVGTHVRLAGELPYIASDSSTNRFSYDAAFVYDPNTSSLSSRRVKSSLGMEAISLIATNLVKRGWVWQGFDTNQVLNWSGTNWVIIQPSNTVTLSFANTPTAGLQGQVIDLWVYWTNTASSTIVWPSTIDIRSNSPAVVFGITNIYHIWFQGTNFYVISDQELTTGSGPLVLQTNATVNTPTITGYAALSGSGSTVYQRVGTNNVTLTNTLGLVHVVSGSVVTFDCNQSKDFSVTNRLTAATTLIVTNSANGQELSAFALGEIAGGTSRVLTIIPDLGHLVFDEDTFGTALATSKAVTVTNGNAIEIRDSVRKLNGTNIHAIVTRQGAF